MSKVPYGFVPIDISKAHTAEPIYHHGANTEQAELLSGELLVTMTTLTPMIVGNYRYEAKTANVKLSDIGIHHAVEPEKSILEPLFAPTVNVDKWKAPILIPPRSIKGMLRHSLGALLNAPMERVQDRQFGFRPNLNRDYDEKAPTKCVPAIVRSVKLNEQRDQMTFLELELLDRLDSPKWIANTPISKTIDRNRPGRSEPARFEAISNRILATLLGTAKAANGRLPKIQTLNGVKEIHHKLEKRGYIVAGTAADSIVISAGSEICTYHPGVDGEGVHAAAHDDNARQPESKYRYLLVPATALTRNKIVLDQNSDALRHLAATYRFLASALSADGDDAEPIAGHLDEHPKIKDGTARKKVRDLIGKRSIWTVGQLVFVELKQHADGRTSCASDVISFGHHFRYWWAYTDSIKRVETSGPTPELRRELKPLKDEQPISACNDAPEKLSAVRSFFGYASVKGHRSTQAGRNEFARLAGRVSPNFAVEVLDGKKRFLDDQNARVLPILGSPKPSAVEFYLKQEKDLTEDHGHPPKKLNTYGEHRTGFEGAELAGRKFYRHALLQGSASEDHKASSQSTIIRFVSDTGRTFRFKLRYRDLRPAELALLITVLEPQRIAALVGEVATEDYAHKLGYARPLGFGSVQFNVASIVPSAPATADSSIIAGGTVDQFIAQQIPMLTKLLRVDKTEGHPASIKRWLEFMRFTQPADIAFPTAEAKGVKTIYSWHSKVRRNHSMARSKE
jgi:CRISPR-associated protein (TIGR03986 family)